MTALLMLLSGPAWAAGDLAAGPTNYEMVEAPTAYILPHGGYDLIMRMYEQGGLFLRGNIGFKDLLMFGFSGNATHVVGTGDIEVQTPGLFFKVKLLDERKTPFSLALAYDGRGYGTQSGGRFFPGLQKGFYAVASKELPDAGFIQLHGGVNAVTFDHFNTADDLGLFGGASFALTSSLVFNLEVNDVLMDDWQFNANCIFNYDNPLRMGVDFRDINNGALFSRILRV
ncbi:MAG TPA: hypothetical protein VMU88_08040, partial [bacterium]|nr:hypothetical protein [bacterium]